MNKPNPKPATKEPEPKVPADLHKVVAADPLIEAVWQGLTPLARQDFVLWIESARQAETRGKRIERVPSMLKSGKRRPCCYTIVPANFYRALEANPKAKAAWKDLGASDRRDFVSWIDAAKQSAEHKSRAVQACSMLAAGHRLGGIPPNGGKAPREKLHRQSADA